MKLANFFAYLGGDILADTRDFKGSPETLRV